jgi:hypothetical protein
MESDDIRSTDLLGDGTDLYRKTMSEDYGDPKLLELQRKVWSPTPWMIDVYEGDGRDKEREIRNWCLRNLGTESSPIHDRDIGEVYAHERVWHRGNVTMHGWTWYGFKTEAMMKRFQEAWPSPNGEV